MKAWFSHHAYSLRLALGRLARAPLASLLNILVIGIALSLPAGLYVALDNLQRLAGPTPGAPEITVFLKENVNEARGRALLATVRDMGPVAGAEFVDRAAGLASLRDSGIADVLAGLEDNPLPHVLVVHPADLDPTRMQALAERLRKLPESGQVLLDGDWATRLNALLRFGRDVVWMLAGLLGLALAAVTGNTIRLQFYALRDEIEVSRLIGATDRFIRRPFLYHGALQGLLGGIAGWALVAGARLALGGHVDRLAAAYGTTFALSGLPAVESLLLLASATLLGLSGAWLAVNHALRRLAA